MHFKVTYTTWLVAALFISQTICQEKAAGDGHGGGGGSDSSHGGGGGGSGGSGGSGGGGSGGSGGGSGGAGGGSGGAGGGSGGAGGGSGGAGGGGSGAGSGSTMPVAMNGMSGIQLPFPFFPPFGCDTICQPIQFQVIQQQVQDVVSRPAPTTQPPTTHPPTTTPPPRTTTQAPRPPAPTTTSYTSQTIIMYPNWCQGWCKFFYQPPPQPVYYQPNCLLFSWMGLGSGMAMGMPTTSTHM